MQTHLDDYRPSPFRVPHAFHHHDQKSDENLEDLEEVLSLSSHLALGHLDDLDDL
jgi:hypothetical protein